MQKKKKARIEEAKKYNKESEQKPASKLLILLGNALNFSWWVCAYSFLSKAMAGFRVASFDRSY